MPRPLLQIVICSTRPGRVGPAVAEWITAAAEADGRFAVEVVDLAEVNLPMFDEPRHPRLHQYEHQHTRDWSATIDRADAFIFVLPEYNYGYNAAHQERHRLPAPRVEVQAGRVTPATAGWPRAPGPCSSSSRS